MCKQACIIIVIFVLLSGCRGCLHQFYGTNSHAYLNLIFQDTSLNYSLRTYYIDSVLNKDIHFPESIKSKFYINSVQTDLHEGDKLIHFKEGPEEWYLVELLGGSQSVIDAIYNSDLSEGAIFDKTDLTESQIKRIRDRMQTEILAKMKLYGQRNHIPE